jgi:hypothetical protein
MILAKTHVYDIDDPKYPPQWIYNEEGEPYCTRFIKHEQWILEHKVVKRVSKKQLKLFEVK